MHPHPDGSRASRLFGLFLVIVLIFIAGDVGKDATGAAQANRWPAVECTITTSVVETDAKVDSHEPYKFHTAYRYVWRGKNYLGGTFRKHYRGTSDIAEAERLVRAYRVNSRRSCYVDPAHPSEAILEHDDVWGYRAGLAALAAAVALLARLYIFAPRTHGQYVDFALGRPMAFFLCLMCSLGGTAAFVWWFVLPLEKTRAARNWTPTPCTVISRLVRENYVHGEVPLTLFRPDIVYSYRVNGENYRSNCYNFTDLESIWYYGKRGIVNRYTQGARVICYVNPLDPSDAVLTRQVRPTILYGLMPLTMAVIGTIGTYGSATRREIRLRSTRVWTTLLLATAWAIAVFISLLMAADLKRDWKAGTAAWLEFAGVAAAASIAIVLLLFLFKGLLSMREH